MKHHLIRHGHVGNAGFTTQVWTRCLHPDCADHDLLGIDIAASLADQRARQHVATHEPAHNEATP